MHGLKERGYYMCTMTVPRELLEALATNGFAYDSATLNYVIAHTMQDGQYSAAARRVAEVLAKYEVEYGHLTVKQLKSM